MDKVCQPISETRIASIPDYFLTAEATLGRWFSKTGRRADIFLATKFGAFDPSTGSKSSWSSKPSLILEALQRSLTQLQTTYIDLYYQHRVDPNVPIEVVLETLRPAVEAGTVRWLGLSECDAETLRRAKAVEGLGEKVVAVQMESSPFSLDIGKNGLAEAAGGTGRGHCRAQPPRARHGHWEVSLPCINCFYCFLTAIQIQISRGPGE